MKALLTAFADQSVACANLGSPWMGRLFAMLAEHWPAETQLAQKCASFQGDVGPAGVSLPLRIAGGLHALHLNNEPDLAPAYPPNTPDDATFKRTILAALETHETFLIDWIDSPPQTNELRRSAALIPGAHIAAAKFDLPIYLSELGASGGLNLLWDHVALETPNQRFGPKQARVTLRPEWSGEAPALSHPTIAERRGVDLNPLDPTSPEDLLRLMSYLWPDQPERLDMTKAVAGAAPAPVDKADAIDWLEHRLVAAPEGHLHLIQNTVAWQYFPPETQAHGLALLTAAGAAATRDRPLAWLQLETDGDLHGLGGAAITLQMWPSGDVINLGRADFHGRWVRWTNPS